MGSTAKLWFLVARARRERIVLTARDRLGVASHGSGKITGQSSCRADPRLARGALPTPGDFTRGLSGKCHPNFGFSSLVPARNGSCQGRGTDWAWRHTDLARERAKSQPSRTRGWPGGASRPQGSLQGDRTGAGLKGARGGPKGDSDTFFKRNMKSLVWAPLSESANGFSLLTLRTFQNFNFGTPQYPLHRNWFFANGHRNPLEGVRIYAGKKFGQVIYDT